MRFSVICDLRIYEVLEKMRFKPNCHIYEI